MLTMKRHSAILFCALAFAIGIGSPSADEAEGRGDAGSSTDAGVDRAKRDPTSQEVLSLEESRKTDLELMIRRTQDFREVVDAAVRRVYHMRREFIDGSFQEKIKAEEDRIENARKEAIAYFEEFLRKYPTSPPYTPDAMYRLAELYYDDSYIKYLDELQEYGQLQDRGLAANVDPPVKEFDRTISIFRKLVKDYPDYRNVDGAYYLLGYTLNDTAREEEARLAWLNLVCANKYQYKPGETGTAKAGDRTAAMDRPAATLDTGVAYGDGGAFVDPFAGCRPISKESRFYFESWWLIGNYHFDYDTSQYGVETAIAAYKKLVEDPQHKFYDKGLYKLAWSYYKADMYPEAIDSFSEVVDYADSNKDAKGSGMRPEAIQYLAVCFFAEDWDLDMMPDQTSGIDRLQDPRMMPQDREWTREVYARLGDIYADNEKNEEAIRVWQIYLEKWPLDAQAPFIQEKIALAYNKMRRFEDEIDARSKLDAYGPDSEWWQANEDNPAAQNEVARMARDALLEAAYHHHRTAQNLRQRGMAAQDGVLLERAVEEYNRAADAYRKFISQNPDTPDAYDINFNLAETLFWSGQYSDAKEEYIAVRDSNLDDKYRSDAAYMVVMSLQELVKQAENNGTLALREQPPEVDGAPPTVDAEPIPPLLVELMKEEENLLADVPNHEEAAAFRYKIAQNYYRYGHWDEAKNRYEKVYDTYCKTDPVAYISWQTLMNMASDLEDLDERERLALKQKEKQCRSEGDEQVADIGEAIDIDTVLGDVAMQRSLDRFKECMDSKDATVCSEAGDKLTAAVSQAPDHPSADAALHNAALAYESAQRFNTAIQVYGRIINEYPESPFVGKCLFQQGLAAQKFFEYEKALDNYRILADEQRFSDYENRTVAVYNSADILTNLQSYTDAVPYWKRYAKEETDRIKSIEASFNAADMYFRAKKWKEAISAYDEYIKQHGNDKEAGPYVVKATYRIGLAQKNRGRLKEQAQAWKTTVQYYDSLVAQPGSISAEYAAESHFSLIEEDMRQFEKFQIKGNQKAIDTKIKFGAEQVKEFETRYREVQKYRRPEWSLAAEFRIGYAYEVYAKALLNVPFPPLDREAQQLMKQLPPEDREMVMLELEDKFRMQMEKLVEPMEKKAQEEYRLAVDLARKGNISNEWTLLALERMNAYDPDNYPRQHNGDIVLEDRTFAAPQWGAEIR